MPLYFKSEQGAEAFKNGLNAASQSPGFKRLLPKPAFKIRRNLDFKIHPEPFCNKSRTILRATKL